MEFPKGWGGPLCEPILENPEGMRGNRKNPFRGGGGGLHSPFSELLDSLGWIGLNLTGNFSSHNMASFTMHLPDTDILLQYLYRNYISHPLGNKVEQLLTFVIPGEGITLSQGILTSLCFWQHHLQWLAYLKRQDIFFMASKLIEGDNKKKICRRKKFINPELLM